MSLLTRDEILDAHANCNEKCNSFYMPCPLNNIDCEIAVREAIKSLRDDHNAAIEKNKELTAQLTQVTEERDALNDNADLKVEIENLKKGEVRQ